MNTPDILFKYISSDVAHLILEKGLSYSRVSNFWDADPCEFNFIYPKIGIIELKRVMENFCRQYHDDENISVLKDILRVEEKRLELLRILNNPASMDALKKSARDAIVDRYYICSLSGYSNNDELWKKYANNHDGVMLALSVDGINLVNASDIDFLKKVTYKDSLSLHSIIKIYTRLANNKDIIFTKMKKYEWANEYRLLLNTERAYSEKHIFSALPFEKNKNHYIHDNRLSQFLVSITFGSNCNTEVREKIEKIVDQKYPQVELKNEKTF